MKSFIPICFLVAAALTVVAVEQQTKSTATVASNKSQSPDTTYVLKEIPYSAVHHGLAGFPRLRLWQSTSGNWSGYAVPLDTSGTTDTYSEVSGTWTIPTVTGVNGSSTTNSSAWVGLDGYNSGSVEQTGSEQDWTGTAQSNYVWFEMYPNPAYEITGFPANAGDSISAVVQYTGQKKKKVGNRTILENTFHLTIKNTTQKKSYSVPASYTEVPAATSIRSSAEWVVEAPYSGQILPLANFGTAYFSKCEAASALSGGVLSPISFWTPDPLTMIDPEGGQAVPSALSADGQSFSVTYTGQ